MSKISYSMMTLVWGTSGALFVISNTTNQPIYFAISIMFLCIVMFFFCVRDFSKKFGLVLFFITMFTFLVGGAFLPLISGESDWQSGLAEHEYIVACNCLYFAVVFLIVGYAFWGKVKIKISLRNRKEGIFQLLEDTNFFIYKMQKIVFGIFIVSTLIAILGESDRLLYSIQHGYMALYTDYSQSGWVQRARIISTTSFFIGLATRPKKRILYIYLILGIVNPLFEMMEGARSQFMMYVLFVIFYLYTLPNFKNGNSSQYNDKKRLYYLIFAGILISLFVIPALYTYGYTRVGREYEQSETIFGYIFDFFKGQSGSFAILGYAERYKGELPGICYSFGTIIDRIVGNNYVANTVDAAVKTNQFGAAITYAIKPYSYLHGVGLGSSYIAEVFYDFGYIGVIIVNFLIGGVLNKLSNWNQNSIFKQSIMYILFYYMLTIPRSSLMNPIVQLISISTIMTIVTVFGFSHKRKGRWKIARKD